MENEATWKSYINDFLIETMLARDVFREYG